MQMTHETLGDDLLIRLEGRMDIAGAAEVDLPFSSLLANRAGLVVVDLSGVTYMASLGVRTFVMNAKALAARGGRMRLVSPQPAVREVFDTVSLDAIIPIFESVEAARAGG